MFRIVVHEHAENDLESLYASDPTAAALVLVLLEELEGATQEFLKRLLDHGYRSLSGVEFDVKKWLAQWNKKKDLWRLKVWSLDGEPLRHRVIYAYLPKTHQYHVLAIVPRGFNYDEKHPISQRILADYAEL